MYPSLLPRALEASKCLPPPSDLFSPLLCAPLLTLYHLNLHLMPSIKSRGYPVSAILLDLQSRQHACTRAHASIQSATYDLVRARSRRDLAKHHMQTVGEGQKDHISTFVYSSYLCMLVTILQDAGLGPYQSTYQSGTIATLPDQFRLQSPRLTVSSFRSQDHRTAPGRSVRG